MEKTLRDEFAMAALTGLLSNAKTFDIKLAIKTSFVIADHMLEAREIKS